PLPSPNCESMTWDGTNLLLVEPGDGELHHVDPITGRVVRQTRTGVRRVRAIAWDGSHLWMTEWGPLSPDRIHRVDISDPQIPISRRAPTAAARSLTSDGTHLWLADTGTNRVYKVDKATGRAVDQF